MPDRETEYPRLWKSTFDLSRCPEVVRALVQTGKSFQVSKGDNTGLFSWAKATHRTSVPVVVDVSRRDIAVRLNFLVRQDPGVKDDFIIVCTANPSEVYKQDTMRGREHNWWCAEWKFYKPELKKNPNWIPGDTENREYWYDIET